MAVTLKAAERATRPRALRNQLRHEGKIPAVVYGYKVDSTSVSVDEKELSKLLRENGANTVITLDVNGKKINTLLHKVQTNTFTRAFEHVEFLSVNMNVATEVETEVALVGEAAGVKAGGVLAQTAYTLVVSATPENLPDNVEVDVTNLEIGDSLTVADLPKAKTYEIVTDPETQIVSVMEPREEEPEEAGEVSEAAEPEVVGEAKEDAAE